MCVWVIFAEIQNQSTHYRWFTSHKLYKTYVKRRTNSKIILGSLGLVACAVVCSVFIFVFTFSSYINSHTINLNDFFKKIIQYTHIDCAHCCNRIQLAEKEIIHIYFTWILMMLIIFKNNMYYIIENLLLEF